jgi:uncharacterized protein YqeY
MAFYQRHAVENSTRSQALSVSGRKLPRDAKALELPENIDISIVVISMEIGFGSKNQDSEVSPLKQKLADDLKQALTGGDKIRCSVIRLVMAAIKNAEIARQTVLEDADILGVIAKEIRQRHESIEAFKQGNRQDLVVQEETELAILEGYLPQQMTREEIVQAARKVIGEVGAQGPGDKGKVMPKLIAQLKGRADGREINAVVTELLAS